MHSEENASLVAAQFYVTLDSISNTVAVLYLIDPKLAPLTVSKALITVPNTSCQAHEATEMASRGDNSDTDALQMLLEEATAEVLALCGENEVWAGAPSSLMSRL